MPDDGFSYWRDVLPGLLVMALGMAASVAPLITAVMNSATDAHVGVASGANNAISRCAGLIAAALLGFVLVRQDPDALAGGFATAALIGAGLAAASALATVLLVRSSAEASA